MNRLLFTFNYLYPSFTQIMKKVLLLLIVGFIGFGAAAQEIEWLTFEEAVKRAEKKPKKLLIDVYTDWCGWCKKMDKDAYANAQITKYINENYYAVKFNAEQKENIEFNGHTFKYLPNGNRGIHELALALTNNKPSYPTTVFMDEEYRILQPIPGYLNAQSMEPILAYFGSDSYKNKVTWEEFQKNFKSEL